MHRIRSFELDDLDGLIEFCNRQISAVPYTPRYTRELFSRRVLRHPSFDPGDLLLAVDGSEITGLAHVGFWPRPEKTSPLTSWLGPYWEYGTIVNLLFPSGDHERGSRLVAAAEERILNRGRTRFAAFSRLGGYLFYKDLLLAGEPLCWDGLSHVQQVLLDAGYERTEPTVLMGRHMTTRPDEIPARIELENHVEEVPAEETAALFSGFGGKPGRRVCAYHRGEGAGSCWFAALEDTVTTAEGEPIASFGMGTADRYQRKGVGTQLLGHALGLMWDQGIRKVVLQTGDDNISAIGLYQKLGFTVELGAHAHGFKRG